MRTSSINADSWRLSEATSTSWSVRSASLESSVIAGIIHHVTVHQPDPTPGSEPERGLALAVLLQGVDPDAELAELRELARRRISILRRRLAGLSKQRDIRRKERRRTGTPTVALAGYTNVGKSTLLNALTDANVSVEDRLFETLDPTTRGFEYEGRRYLVTDTVGFVRRLPHQLVEGFASTLEETLVADLVLHVADASQPEDTLVEQLRAVEAVLAEIGASELPVQLVLNKIDELDPLGRRRLANRFPEAVQVSALTGKGLAELRGRVADHFSERFEEVRLLLPYEEGARLAELYALGAPVDERRDEPEGVFVRARLPRRALVRFAPYLIADAESRS